MSGVYLSVALADAPGAEATRAAWTAGLLVPSEVVVAPSRNAAIRQATGEFIVATKAGVLPSIEVIALANARALDASAFYRADLLEVSEGVRRLWTREGCARVSADGIRLPEDQDIFPADGSVRLGKGWFPLESDAPYRWLESTAEFEIVRPDWALPELLLDVESGPSAGGPLALEVVNDSGAVLLAATVEGRSRLRLPVSSSRERLTLRVAGGRLPLDTDLRLLNLRVWDLRWRSPWEGGTAGGPRIILQGAAFPGKHLDVRHLEVSDLGGGEFSLSLRYRMTTEAPVEAAEPARDWGAPSTLPASEFLHSNAAEEFVLMSRAWWLNLRGWPEIRLAAQFVETLFCYAAHYAGLREVILAEPFQCTTRDVPNTEGPIDESRVRGWVTQMRRLGAPMILNRGDWGK
ncbi:MAG: hypothetical protein ABI806_05300 [Candidatus Solibacter sp.]